MSNMMPLSRHVLSLQTGLHRQFILGTVIPPTMVHEYMIYVYKLVEGMKEGFLDIAMLLLSICLPMHWLSCSILPEAFHRYFLLPVFTTHALIDPLPKITFIPFILNMCSK